MPGTSWTPTFRVEHSPSSMVVGPIESVEVSAPSPATDEVLPVYAALPEAAEKILVFSNARKRVDHLAASLRPSLSALGYSVLAHHGSLSQDVREDAEACDQARPEGRPVRDVDPGDRDRHR